MSSQFYTGQIIWGAFPDTPPDMVPCDGRELLVQSYQALFSVLLYTFGGSGTKFAIPDLRGRTPIGWGVGENNKFFHTAQKGGVETVKLTNQQIPTHTHGLRGTAQPGTAGYLDNIIASAGAKLANNPYNIYAAAVASFGQLVALAPGNVRSIGDDGSHNNMQPFLALNAFMVVNGFHPPRPVEADPELEN